MQRYLLCLLNSHERFVLFDSKFNFTSYVSNKNNCWREKNKMLELTVK